MEVVAEEECGVKRAFKKERGHSSIFTESWGNNCGAQSRVGER